MVKLHLLLVIPIIVVVTMILFHQHVLAQTTSFLIYDNPNLGIKIQYPSDWIKFEFSNNLLSNNTNRNEFPYNLIPNDINSVEFIKKEKVTNQSVASVEARVQSRPLEIKTIEDLRNYVILGLANKTGHNINTEIINSSETTLSNLPAFKIFYNVPQIHVLEGIPNVPAKKVMRIETLNPSIHKSYAILYFAQSDLFNTYLPTVQKMISSFRIAK
jgi:hypothetical protein